MPGRMICEGCEMPFYSYDDEPYCSQQCYEFVIEMLGNRLRSQVGQHLQGRALKNAVIGRLKVVMGCIDCGFNFHHAALDFDHVYGTKKFAIARSVNLYDCLREATKCEVRCANCHRIRTWNRAEAAKAVWDTGR